MDPATPPPEGTITTERRGPLLLVGIDRPAKRNGFTPRMFRELGEAYTLLDDDPSLRVGVLFAHGDHFTAGLDPPPSPPRCRRARSCGRPPAWSRWTWGRRATGAAASPWWGPCRASRSPSASS